VNWNPDGSGLIGNRSGYSLPDPPGGISRKLITAAVLEFINCFHQTHIAFLD